MRRRYFLACLSFLSLVVVALPTAVALAQPQPMPPPDRAALEKEFAERMSGATLIGSFTVTGEPAVELKPEKYTLGQVKKLNNGYWLFNARIQYGDKDVTLPLPLKVEWAGDTPVVTLTRQEVPGFGRFTVRVLFYDDHYAGFWSGGDHGGHLFGTIQPAAAPAPSAAPDAQR